MMKNVLYVLCIKTAKRKVKNASLVLACFIGYFLTIPRVAAADDSYLVEAQKKLQATFSGLNVVDFRPSQIPELFEINLGSKIIYYYPGKELILFGEIFDKDGTSLTGESLKRQATETMGKVALSSALVLGDGQGIELIEFCDPDCPYSRRFDALVRSLATQYKISRKIFFELRGHPAAKQKAIHILCSPDPDKALAQILLGEQIELRHCAKAEEWLQQQAAVAESLGVSGTPTFVQEGKLVTGLKPTELIDFLEIKSTCKKEDKPNVVQKNLP